MNAMSDMKKKAEKKVRCLAPRMEKLLAKNRIGGQYYYRKYRNTGCVMTLTHLYGMRIFYHPDSDNVTCSVVKSAGDPWFGPESFELTNEQGINAIFDVFLLFREVAIRMACKSY